MCFLGSPPRAHLLVFPLTCSDRRIVVRSFVPTTAFKFRYRTAAAIGYPGSPRRRLKRRYRSSVAALYVRGFIARLCTAVQLHPYSAGGRDGDGHPYSFARGKKVTDTEGIRFGLILIMARRPFGSCAPPRAGWRRWRRCRPP